MLLSLPTSLLDLVDTHAVTMLNGIELSFCNGDGMFLVWYSLTDEVAKHTRWGAWVHAACRVAILSVFPDARVTTSPRRWNVSRAVTMDDLKRTVAAFRLLRRLQVDNLMPAGMHRNILSFGLRVSNTALPCVCRGLAAALVAPALCDEEVLRARPVRSFLPPSLSSRHDAHHVPPVDGHDAEDGA